MGVKIGQVSSIEFVSAVYDIPTDPEKVSRYERYVRILCSISAEESKERAGDTTEEQREARVRNLMQQGLRLRLASNILTGQGYLEGVFVDPNRFPILSFTWEPKHIYVASAPGEFSTMKDSLDKILEKLEEIEFQKIVDNINQLLVVARETVEDANVPGVTGEMKGFFAELRGTNQRIRQLVKDANVPGVTGEMKGFFAELRGTNQRIRGLLTSPDPNTESVNLQQIMVRLDSILERIDRETSNKMVDIDRFIRNMRAISDDVKELTAMLKKDPAEIIFSQPPAKSEIVK
jgi:paraquat-inducible protein B